MKTKILLAVGFLLIVGAAIFVSLQSRRGFTIEETHLPQVMSNYTKALKLDTSTPYFPDGKSNASTKTKQP
jgi:hypothetical protein